MTVIFRDNRYAIEHHKAPGGTGRLVLTFSYYRFGDLDAKGFGEQFLLAQGYDVIVFKSNANCWFQGISDEVLETVRRATERYPFVAAYGSSLGAYAAIAFANHLRPDLILAVSPQFAIDQEFDTRWAEEARNITWSHRIDAKAVSNATYYLVHDTAHPLEVEQARRVTEVMPDRSTIKIGIPFSGHPSTFFLNETGQLGKLVLDVLAGHRKIAVDQSWSVTGRSKVFLQQVGQQAARQGRDALSERCFRRAIALGEPSPVLYHDLAFLLAQQGRLDEAISYTRKCIEGAPHLPQFLNYLAILLNRNGQIAEALSFVGKAQKLDPGNPGNAQFIARLRKRAEQQAGGT